MGKEDAMPVELLHRLLECDPVAGTLTWKARTPDLFGGDTPKQGEAWNRRYAGKLAFTSKKTCGYNQSSMFGNNYAAHRVMWAMVNGEWR